MDVHVDLRRRDLDEDERRREPAGRHHFGIRAQHRMPELPVAHGPSVDEKPHRADAGMLDGRRRCKTVRTHPADARLEGQQLSRDFAPERLRRALLAESESLAAPEMQEQARSFTDGEIDVRARYREPQHRLHRVRLLRRYALEELLAGGDVEEQIAPLDRGALRSARLAGGDEAPSV